MTNPLIDRYRQRLSAIPEPGGGGCHTALLGVANLGIKAGLDPQRVFDDIRRSIPGGRRKVTDKEIHDAINRALQDAGKQAGAYQKSKPVIRDGKAALQRIIAGARCGDDLAVTLWEASPIRIDWDQYFRDTVNFLKTVFHPDDLLWIGDRHEAGILGENIRTAAAWVDFFQAGGKAGPFIIINPLDGTPREKRSGAGETFRGDQNVKTFRHCLVEFDDLSRDDQIRFWLGIKLPIKALIDTGRKSIHGLVDVSSLEICTADGWDREIKHHLFDEILVPLGVDRACKNAARLSRLPGVTRPETGKLQRLLWLSPTGRRCADV